ncbi:MAG: hypothetical protein LC754_09520 [Acidobacteria bacterium]|nr:hypothetical protein [Acidobacteriota bacterium]
MPSAFRWDERVLRWRAPAWEYRHVVKDLIRGGTPYEDRARAYHEWPHRLPPRDARTGGRVSRRLQRRALKRPTERGGARGL